jgi:hypothetical protein
VGAAEIPITLYSEAYAFLAGYPDPPAGWIKVPGTTGRGGGKRSLEISHLSVCYRNSAFMGALRNLLIMTRITGSAARQRLAWGGTKSMAKRGPRRTGRVSLTAYTGQEDVTVPGKLRPAYILSVLVALLAAVQSAASLLLPPVYRDNDLIVATWRGNDFITLLVAVPLLVGALALARRGSSRALLLWAGLLDYMLYNYAFYLFGTAFNSHFLVYTAIVGLSIFALICLLMRLDVPGLAQQFGARTPVRLIAGYMLLVAVALGGLWTAMSLGFVLTGQVPSPVVSSGHVTAIVFALDLTMVMPPMALGAIWLWQRQPWGYVLAAGLGIKGAVYMLALSAATISAMLAGIPGAGAELPIWAGVGLGALVSAYLLLSHMTPVRTPDDRRRQAGLKRAGQTAR